MGKLDELRRFGAGTAAESMGVGVAPIPGNRPPSSNSAPPQWQGVTKSRAAAEIEVDRIGPDPAQPREEFEPEALERLAESLRTRGLLQPIRVRWDEAAGRYIIVCGERRWRAARMAGLATVTAIIADGPATPGELLALQLVENALREDLKPIEQARAFRALMDARGWSARQVARELAFPQSTLVKVLALLELPDSVQERVESGAVAPATAYEIARLPDPSAQDELAARVAAGELTRDDVAAEVRRRAGRSAGPKGRGATGGKARKVTERRFRTSDGSKLTIENRRGVEAAAIRAALLEVLGQVDAELGGGTADAA